MRAKQPLGFLLQAIAHPGTDAGTHTGISTSIEFRTKTIVQDVFF